MLTEKQAVTGAIFFKKHADRIVIPAGVYALESHHSDESPETSISLPLLVRYLTRKRQLVRYASCEKHNHQGTCSTVYTVEGVYFLSDGKLVYKDRTTNNPLIIKQLVFRQIKDFSRQLNMAILEKQNTPSYLKTKELVIDENKNIYIVMTRMPGEVLTSVIERYNLTVDEQFDITIKSLKALNELHDVYNLLHIDIKTQNMLIGERVWFIDFGLARPRHLAGYTFASTLGFSPPESYYRSPPSIKSDTYSLGIALIPAWKCFDTMRFNDDLKIPPRDKCQSFTFKELAQNNPALPYYCALAMQALLLRMTRYEPLMRIDLDEAILMVKEIAALYENSKENESFISNNRLDDFIQRAFDPLYNFKRLCREQLKQAEESLQDGDYRRQQQLSNYHKRFETILENSNCQLQTLSEHSWEINNHRLGGAHLQLQQLKDDLLTFNNPTFLQQSTNQCWRIYHNFFAPKKDTFINNVMLPGEPSNMRGNNPA